MVAFRDDLSLETLEVALIAGDPLVRAGLAAALSVEPRVHVSERPLAAGSADAVIWEGPLDRTAPPTWSQASAAGPVVTLTESTKAAVEALSRGARGVVPRESPGGRVAAAARAVAAGLLVLGPGYEQLRGSVRARTLREPLTPREQQVLLLLVEGRSNPEIGERLGISEHTAKFHVNAVLSKLGVQRRTEVAVAAAKLGLVSL